jgi:hypothetical protein
MPDVASEAVSGVTAIIGASAMTKPIHVNEKTLAAIKGRESHEPQVPVPSAPVGISTLTPHTCGNRRRAERLVRAMVDRIGKDRCNKLRSCVGHVHLSLGN